jgi:hypothetical protein
MAMTGYVVSLLMGLVVGVAYGLVQVRSPASSHWSACWAWCWGNRQSRSWSAISAAHRALDPAGLTGCPRTSLASLPAGASHERVSPEPRFLPKRGGLVVVPEELGLSEITVKIHRGHMTKLRVQSLADLVRAA